MSVLGTFNAIYCCDQEAAASGPQMMGQIYVANGPDAASLNVLFFSNEHHIEGIHFNSYTTLFISASI